MADDKRDQDTPPPNHPSRREFVTTMVAGLAVAASGTSAAELPVVEKSVEIKTPDGTCDAAFIHPVDRLASGRADLARRFRPAAVDARDRQAAGRGGLSRCWCRTRSIASPRRRCSRTPSTFSFSNPADRAKLTPLMGSMNAPGAAEKDAVAFVAFLDAQPQVNTAKKIGTQGYCMGGPLVVRTAAAVPERIGAGASFHGGGLVTDKSRQPASARAEDQGADVFRHRVERRHAQPDAKDKLKEAFAAAKVPAEIEVYSDRSTAGACRTCRSSGRHADLQQAGRGARLGQADRAVQGRARMRTAAAGLTGARV